MRKRVKTLKLLETFIFNNPPLAVEGGAKRERKIHEIRGFH